MSTPREEPKLDPCGCCEAELPQPKRDNRPGQPALDYRLGTHSSFLRRMLARLCSQIMPDGPTLAALTTRASDDPAIALLDAWATVADVFTFYQERIANEGYLPTATERRSVLELARAIGYELNPGVAASTYMAFTVEEAPGAPEVVTVPQGIQVQSIPSLGKLPQTFETVEEIEARAEWNALKPRPTVLQEIDRGITELYLKGVNTQLEPGDAILLVGDDRDRRPGSERWDFRILQTVTPCPEKGYTLVTWEEALGHERPTVEPADNPKVFAFRQRAALFGYNAPDWRAMSEEIKEAYAGADWKRRRQWPGFEIGEENQIYLDAAYPKILEGSWIVLMKPTYVELYEATDISAASRTDFTLTAKTTRIELDTREHLSWFGLRDTVVFAQSEQLKLAEKPLTTPVYGKKIVLSQVVTVLEKGQAVIVSGKLIQSVRVARRTHVVKVEDKEVIRAKPDLLLTSVDGSQQAVLKPGDLLQVVERPSLEPGGRIKWHLMDRNGFAGFVTVEPDEIIPEPAVEDDESVSELAFIEDVSGEKERTTLTLKDPLQNSYDRTTVVIHANVARATHGETVKEEVLGSGDGWQANQRFVLKKPPMTYVSAPTASGAKSTLKVGVNEVLWQEVPSLYGLDERSQSYIVHIDNDAKATVIFGDGRSGARLPTGQENVVATYRSGIGSDGEVDADSLTLLKTPPLGVREVTNPLAASGAADPETLDDARDNAPLTVLTLDRVVSLRDFEDFARAFAGIGKAQVVALWNGETQLVHITVASASGDPIDRTSDLYLNLTRAIRAVCEPMQTFRVDDYQPLLFNLAAKVLVDRLYIATDVLSKVESALRSAFAFEQRALGQAITAAEVMSVMQKVPGVVAGDLDQLYLSTDPAGPKQAMPASILSAAKADWDRETNESRPAQLLLLNPAGVALTPMEERP